MCSQNGACSYSDPSGNSLFSCTIVDVTCTASCVCNSGYGGNDCSLTDTVLTARDALRFEFDPLFFVFNISLLMIYISRSYLFLLILKSLLTVIYSNFSFLFSFLFSLFYTQEYTMSSIGHSCRDPRQIIIPSSDADRFTSLFLLTQ